MYKKIKKELYGNIIIINIMLHERNSKHAWEWKDSRFWGLYFANLGGHGSRERIAEEGVLKGKLARVDTASGCSKICTLEFKSGGWCLASSLV